MTPKQLQGSKVAFRIHSSQVSCDREASTSEGEAISYEELKNCPRLRKSCITYLSPTTGSSSSLPQGRRHHFHHFQRVFERFSIKAFRPSVDLIRQVFGDFFSKWQEWFTWEIASVNHHCQKPFPSES